MRKAEEQRRIAEEVLPEWMANETEHRTIYYWQIKQKASGTLQDNTIYPSISFSEPDA